MFEKNLGDINGTGGDSCKGFDIGSAFAFLDESSILLSTLIGIGLIVKGSGTGKALSVFI